MHKIKMFFKNNYDMMSVLLITLGAFMYLFGTPVLDVNNTDLVIRGGDFTVSYLGSVFYRIDEWRWPIFTHMNLAYPYGISVHGTDGSPLLSLIFKALHTFFGVRPDIQYVGIWMLICYMLQAYVSVLIFRHAFKNKFFIIIGSLFFVSAPIMMMRVFVHINLMPHFILLFAILLWMNNELALKQWIYMALLIALGLLTCPYFLPMISGFFAVLIYNRLWRDKKLRIIHLIAGLLFLAAVFGGLYYLLGMASTEQVLASGGWRSLSLNLTALYNPIWSKSQVFNTLTPKADFDADNYFGLGLLIAFLVFFPHVKRLFKAENLKQNAPIALVLLGFVVFALSSQIKAGTTVVLDYNPGAVIDWLGGVFRYSGRFFWPVWYLLAFFLLKTIGTSYPKGARLILPLLLCIQIWDLYPTYNFKKSFVETTKPMPLPMKSSEWDRLNDTYKNIFIFAHNNGYRDIWRWAIEHRKNVNYGFLNRPSKKTNELVNTTREEVLSGYVSDASYFYVIDSDLRKKIDEVAEINPLVAELRSKIQTIDTIQILEYDQELHQKYLDSVANVTTSTIPVKHRYWTSDLVQLSTYRLYRPLENDKDYATIVQYDDQTLTVKWDRYGTETFMKQEDGYYHQVIPEEDKKK